jgi:predicted protein tyrosine phosphatase
MNIKIWRKDEVELGFSKGDYLISILSTHETPLSDEVKSRYKEVLELRIDDIQKEYDGLTLFSMEHRQQVMKFVHGFYEYMSEETLDVHCSAGVSRSPSVALGICVWEGDIGLAYRVIKENKYILPNEYILKMFIEDDRDWTWIIGYFRLKRRVDELDKETLERLVLRLGLDRCFYNHLLKDINRKREWDSVFGDD